MELIETINLINSQKNSIYKIETWTDDNKVLNKAVEKAQKFLNGKLPIELIEFYSKTFRIELITSKKTKYYPKEYRLSSVFSLENTFDKFKPHPVPLTEKPTEYVKTKKSHACSNYFPVEYSDDKKYNEITRQKVLIPIYGTSSVIKLDFYEKNENGYTLKYLESRNSEIYPINLSFTQFMDFHVYFGTENYWFFPFIKEYKSDFKGLTTLRNMFGDLESHKNKIIELEELIKVYK